MSSSDVMQKELADIEQKLASARQAADAPGASERNKADLKLLEQEYLAPAARRTARQAAAQGESNPPVPGRRSKRNSMKPWRRAFQAAIRSPLPSPLL